MPLKITKVLIEELSSASGNLSLEAAAALAAAEQEGEEISDDGDWEDVTGTLDLGLLGTKQSLMGSGAAGIGDGTASILSTRQRDDETQAYLIDFFRDISARNVGGFADIYAALTQDEQQKLSVIGG